MKDEMTKSSKEFYLKSVQKYTKEKNAKKRIIAINAVGLGLTAIAVVISTTIGYITAVDVATLDAHPNEVLRHIFASGFFASVGSIYFLIHLIAGFARKIGLEIRIEEIKAFFAHHGLVLEDEIAKDKGMGMW